MSAKAETRWFVDLVVFISSYFPLFLILLIKDIKPISDINITCSNFFRDDTYLLHSAWSAGLFALSAFCVVLLLIFRRVFFSPERAGQNIVIKSCEPIHGEMLNFTIPFLVGLIGVSYKSWQEIASFMVFLSFMYFFLKKDGSLMLNPMFLLFGFKLYKIQYCRHGDERNEAARVFSLSELNSSSEVKRLCHVKGISLILNQQIERESLNESAG